jgi:pyruvate,water dikinase
MASFVLPFDSPDASLAVAGGKGTNLSRLVRAEFPVPPGFFVITEAYRAFVQANQLQPMIVELASRDPRPTEEVSADIRRLFQQATMPPEVATQIEQLYLDLPQGTAEPPPVAVRSSATAEDLPGASFAGQQDSYLNVRGEEALLEAVKRCWSSLWTARALEYRRRQEIDPSSVSLAVVVQVMVFAEAAGIMFTADPVTGARDEIVIDAAWGLGEAVVGGLVTPDHIVADKATGEVRKIMIAEKALMTVPTPEGTQESAVEPEKQRSRVLDDLQVARLAKLGADIETYYGEPQDIEWCLVDDEFFIVQARPVTALPDEVRWESPVPGAKWLKDLQAAEWATEPLSPLGATTTFATMVAARQRQLPMQRSPWSEVINGWLYIRADFQVSQLALHSLKAVVRLRAGALNGHQRTQRRWPEQLALLESLEEIDLAKLSDLELQAHTDRLLEALGWWWWELSWDAAVALAFEQFIGKLKVPDLADPAILFRGNESLLLEAERALRHAASTGDVEAYLARFGHFVESADPIHPTLRESPDLLTQYLVVVRHSKTNPDERLVRTRRERTEAESFVRALRGPRGFLARRLLAAGQSHAAHVDDAVFHFQRLLALVRATFLQAGQRLVRVRAVERPEDVFYLERDEIWAPQSEQASRVTQRRELRERQRKLAPPPFIPPLSDPTWESDRMWKLMSSAVGGTALRRGAQERDGQRILVGTPGAPGRARGIARVIAGPDDFHRFNPGDVLVAHSTMPIWTPLFNIASAAVTEVGGPFSHASIVAREFGIPLVNGALDATQVIEDGMSIVVDGSTGTVEL